MTTFLLYYELNSVASWFFSKAFAQLTILNELPGRVIN